MALLFCDSFDHYDALTTKWTASVAASINTANQRTGRGCMALGGGGWGSITIGANSTLIAGAAVKPTQGNRTLLSFRDGISDQISVQLNDGSFTLSLKRGSTIIATSAKAIPLNQYSYIELKATIADAGGYAEVRVNGETWITFNGDTQQTGNATADNLNCPCANGFYDDLYICNSAGARANDFLGDVQVRAFVPNADGTYQEWTPSAGVDHYALVDEIPPSGDTDYVAAGAMGLRETFRLNANATGAVLGVQTVPTIRKDDAGVRFVAPLIRSAGVDHLGTPQAVSSTFMVLHQAYSEHPAGREWAAADLAGDEFGAQVTA